MSFVLLLMMLSAQAQDSYAQVEELLANRRYSAALEKLQKATDKNAKWHLLASKAYDGLNNPSQAVAEAETALAADTGNEAAHLQLGQIFLSRNTPDAAFEIYSDALKILPNSFFLRLGRGLALKEMQRYDQAAADLRYCLERQPSSGLVFDALATVLIHHLNFKDTMNLAEKFRDRNPTDFRGYYFLAAARDGLRLDDGESISILTESIRLNSAFAASHMLLGKILLRQNQLPEAISSLERAITLRPDHIPAHMTLARAYRVAGRSNDADREVKILRELNDKGHTPPPALKYHRGRY